MLNHFTASVSFLSSSVAAFAQSGLKNTLKTYEFVSAWQCAWERIFLCYTLTAEQYNICHLCHWYSANSRQFGVKYTLSPSNWRINIYTVECRHCCLDNAIIISHIICVNYKSACILKFNLHLTQCTMAWDPLIHDTCWNRAIVGTCCRQLKFTAL